MKLTECIPQSWSDPCDHCDWRKRSVGDGKAKLSNQRNKTLHLHPVFHRAQGSPRPTIIGTFAQITNVPCQTCRIQSFLFVSGHNDYVISIIGCYRSIRVFWRWKGIFKISFFFLARTCHQRRISPLRMLLYALKDIRATFPQQLSTSFPKKILLFPKSNMPL